MSKLKTSNTFLIGLFVIFAIGLFIAIVIWLGADKLTDESKFYVTYFDSSIDGLNVGSPVKYQGVAGGSVTAIKIAPDGKLVEVQMQIMPEIKINSTIRVQATFSGIAGGKFLQLYYPKDKALMRQHPILSFTPKMELIESSPSEIEGLASAATDIASKLTKIEYLRISNRLYELIDTLTQLVSYSNSLMRNEKSMNILGNIDLASSELAHVLVKLDSLRIYDDLEYTTLNLRKTSDDVLNLTKKIDSKISDINIPVFMARVYSKIDTTTQTMNSAITSIQGQSTGTFLSMIELIEDLKLTNKELQKTLNTFSDDPGRTLFTNPPKREK
jgi:phospholipid/cholesterol/gamma-HCH transport system substrate-binding protein